MYTYETGTLTKSQSDAFCKLFDEKVGTDYEINNDCGFTVLCVEMEDISEVEICRNIETQVTEAAR